MNESDQGTKRRKIGEVLLALGLVATTLVSVGFLSATSASAAARPTTDGLKISWADDGWYQVQETKNYTEICREGRSCVVPRPGLYKVTNHTQKQSWKIEVGPSASDHAPLQPAHAQITTFKFNGSYVTLNWRDVRNTASVDIFRKRGNEDFKRVTRSSGKRWLDHNGRRGDQYYVMAYDRNHRPGNIRSRTITVFHQDMSDSVNIRKVGDGFYHVSWQPVLGNNISYRVEIPPVTYSSGSPSPDTSGDVKYAYTTNTALTIRASDPNGWIKVDGIEEGVGAGYTRWLPLPR